MRIPRWPSCATSSPRETLRTNRGGADKVERAAQQPPDEEQGGGVGPDPTRNCRVSGPCPSSQAAAASGSSRLSGSGSVERAVQQLYPDADLNIVSADLKSAATVGTDIREFAHTQLFDNCWALCQTKSEYNRHLRTAQSPTSQVPGSGAAHNRYHVPTPSSPQNSTPVPVTRPVTVG